MAFYIIPGALGDVEPIHSLILMLFCSPSPLLIILYCTLMGKSSIREGSQSGELTVIRVYVAMKPVMFA